MGVIEIVDSLVEMVPSIYITSPTEYWMDIPSSLDCWRMPSEGKPQPAREKQYSTIASNSYVLRRRGERRGQGSQIGATGRAYRMGPLAAGLQTVGSREDFVWRGGRLFLYREWITGNHSPRSHFPTQPTPRPLVPPPNPVPKQIK